MKTGLMLAAASLLSIISVSAFAGSQDDREGALFLNLSPAAQQFFQRSVEIRAGYAEGDAYKHFLRDRDGDGKIDVMDKDGYLRLRTGDNGYATNPAFYGRTASSSPEIFYRYVRDCETRQTIERQAIETNGEYKNFVGGDRYQQQCVLDGTADEYYVESRQKLEEGEGGKD
ncbi:MAG: hypothetical protein EPN97_17210 [Alphaproteobacteria bacterium]|nr:MAG: hypothetical protein EPN97_17210 [Alphaproteobacteria bacterium]